MQKLAGEFLLLIALLCSSSALYAQENTAAPKNKGVFYVSWGYNKDWYSRSSIHFEDHVTDNYDFIVHDVSACDKPLLNKIFSKNLSIPQYCYRVGYYFNDKRNLGIEISFDHAKYIMNHNQQAHISGYIRDEQLDKDTIIG